MSDPRATRGSPEGRAPGATPRIAAPARFPSFDGLRAIAAVSVLVAHAAGFLWFYESRTWAPSAVQGWLARGGLFGVAVFFVLSGFLLYRPFVAAHFESRPKPRVGPFWLRRFVRIFPAYWVMITVSIFVFGVLNADTFADYLTYYGLLLNYRSGYLGLGIEWTLVVEVSFYLVLPGIAWALRSCVRADAPVITKYRTQIVGLIAIALVSTAVKAWNLWVFRPAPTTQGEWFAFDRLNGWLVSYLDWFAVGMLMAVVSAWVSVGGRLPRVLAALAKYPWLSWLLAIECYWVLTRLKFPWFELPVTTPLQEFVRSEMSIAAAAFLVIPAAFGNPEEGRIRRTLQSRPFVSIGVISYGIYLWHVSLFDVSRLWRADGYFPLTALKATVVICAATFVAATVSYFLVERPARVWAQRVTRSGPKPAEIRVEIPAEVRTPSAVVPDPSPPGPPESEPTKPEEPDLVPFVILGAAAVVVAGLGIVLPSVV